MRGDAQPSSPSFGSLEACNEQRQSMLQQLKLAEKQKDDLEDKKTAAEDFLNKKTLLTKCQLEAVQLTTYDTQVGGQLLMDSCGGMGLAMG